MLQHLKPQGAKAPLAQAAKGFTLIEVMIVVVIIAILSAIALPSYQQYIQKTRRADAKETLLRMATLQERHFFQESEYYSVAALTDFGGQTSPEGWYTIALDCSVDMCAASYTLTATPVNPGPQANDTQCSSFTINQTLQQTAQTAAGADAANCW